MPDDSIHLNTDVLDQLIEANRQQGILDEFRRRAEQMKDKVDEAVYRRVSDDYGAKLAALDASTEPLRVRARVEYDTLCQAYAALEQTRERTRIEKEEIEFRRQIGELDAAQLAERLVGPVNQLDECRQSLERLDQQKLRFVDAFGSEESMLGLDTRRIGPGETTGDGCLPEPRGLLHVEGEGVESAVYALGATARIGRAEDNDICVQSRGISRHHAVVVANVQGFLLRDLGSQNGTVVNGARMAERQLADGDTIALGDAQLRYEARK